MLEGKRAILKAAAESEMTESEGCFHYTQEEVNSINADNNDIQRCLSVGCRINKRKKDPSTYQLLLAIDSSS